MATGARITRKKDIEYPTSDGKPMAETDIHRDDMVDLIQTLQDRYADHPKVYVSGNLLLYYVEGDKRKHLAPDVFLVRGIAKRLRDYYLLWEEKKSPNAVIEVTSKSTRAEDLKTKFHLYQDVLKVKEYILFDPRAEYLDPPLQGYRLQKGRFVPIQLVDGRLPSKELGLHLERVGVELRLYDPATGQRLPTRKEAREREAQARAQAEARTQQAEAQVQREAQARARAEAEAERLRREIEALRDQLQRPI
jgi:Uma2 family endonuclease